MSISRLCSLFSLVALTGLAACGGGGGGDGPAPAPPAPAPAPEPIPPAPYTTCSDAGKTVAAASTATNTVCMLTTQGEIVVELYNDKTPITVTNFLQYVAAKRYDNTLYHRVVKGFVVQGGGYTTDGIAVVTYPMIKIEADKGLSNVRGTIAMARLGSANPDTATSQFFFNAVDNSACLDAGKKTNGCDPNGYAVFGKVIAGLDTIDKIAAVPVYSDGLPVTRVVTYWAEQLK